MSKEDTETIRELLAHYFPALEFDDLEVQRAKKAFQPLIDSLKDQ